MFEAEFINQNGYKICRDIIATDINTARKICDWLEKKKKWQLKKLFST